jgi:hypothetical protein
MNSEMTPWRRLRDINARQQLVVEREMHQFNGAVAVQFAQHVGAMDMHRFVAEIELEGNLFYAVAFDQ